MPKEGHRPLRLNNYWMVKSEIGICCLQNASDTLTGAERLETETLADNAYSSFVAKERMAIINMAPKVSQFLVLFLVFNLMVTLAWLTDLFK